MKFSQTEGLRGSLWPNIHPGHHGGDGIAQALDAGAGDVEVVENREAYAQNKQITIGNGYGISIALAHPAGLPRTPVLASICSYGKSIRGGSCRAWDFKAETDDKQQVKANVGKGS